MEKTDRNNILKAVCFFEAIIAILFFYIVFDGRWFPIILNSAIYGGGAMLGTCIMMDDWLRDK